MDAYLLTARHPSEWVIFAAQVTPPEAGDNAWAWIAGAMAATLIPAIVVLFWQVTKRADSTLDLMKEDRNTWKEAAAKASDELSKTTTSLAKTSDAIQSQVSIIASALEQANRAILALSADLSEQTELMQRINYRLDSEGVPPAPPPAKRPTRRPSP